MAFGEMMGGGAKGLSPSERLRGRGGAVGMMRGGAGMGGGMQGMGGALGNMAQRQPMSGGGGMMGGGGGDDMQGGGMQRRGMPLQFGGMMGGMMRGMMGGGMMGRGNPFQMFGQRFRQPSYGGINPGGMYGGRSPMQGGGPPMPPNWRTMMGGGGGGIDMGMAPDRGGQEEMVPRRPSTPGGMTTMDMVPKSMYEGSPWQGGGPSLPDNWQTMLGGLGPSMGMMQRRMMY